MSTTVAFVDDDERCINSMRIVMSDLATCSRWKLLFFTDPTEALTAVRETQVTALVTDEHMPSMSGRDLIRQARESSPDLVTILLSGDSGANIPDTIIVEKPCQTIKLVEMIKTAIERTVGECSNE